MCVRVLLLQTPLPSGYYLAMYTKFKRERLFDKSKNCCACISHSTGVVCLRQLTVDTDLMCCIVGLFMLYDGFVCMQIAKSYMIHVSQN